MSLVATESRDPEELAAEARALAAEVKSLKASLVSEQKQHAKVKAYKIDMEAALVRAAEAWFADQPTPTVPKPHRDGRKKGEEVAFPLFSDTHYGAVTHDYNGDIAERRTRLYAEKICELASIQRADHPVRRVHVAALGDIVTGELIFPTAPYEMDMTLMEQLTGGGFKIARDFILRLLVDFEKVHIDWVEGNHGRVGPRKGSVFHPDTNADRILGSILRIAFANESRVTWNIPRHQVGQIGWCAVAEEGNYRALLVHGHQFRGGSSYGGIPYYGVERKAVRYANLAGKGDLPPFTDIYCGHYHRVAKIPAGTCKVRMNGSMQSTSPFELEQLAAFSPPAQMLVFVHPEKGIVTSEHEVYLG